MTKKSKYDLTDARQIKVPQSIWKLYVKRYGEDAAEQARDDLDLCIGVEDKNGQMETDQVEDK